MLYEIVDAFETRVAEYAGAKYGVAVRSCTDALLLSLLYRFKYQNYYRDILIPERTYIGVAQSVINAGAKCRFYDREWIGAYHLFVGREDSEDEFVSIRIVDSARRFKKGMYESGTLYCLSFHETKHMPIGDGGMILTDDIDEYKILRKMRFDGRTPGVAPKDDEFIQGYHCHMKPDTAARGLMLMQNAKDEYPDIPADWYGDLSKQEIFRRGV